MTDRDAGTSRAALAAHRTLDAHLVALTDEHVVPRVAAARLERRARAHAPGPQRRRAANVLRAAVQRGEVGAMYPGGLDQRTADIDAGVGPGPAHRARGRRPRLVGPARGCARGNAPTTPGCGEGIGLFGPVTVDDVPFRRWREAEVHHVDLGLEYSWRDWPAEYVRLELQRLTMLWDSRRAMGLTGLPRGRVGGRRAPPGGVVARPRHHRRAGHRGADGMTRSRRSTASPSRSW